MHLNKESKKDSNKNKNNPTDNRLKQIISVIFWLLLGAMGWQVITNGINFVGSLDNSQIINTNSNIINYNNVYYLANDSCPSNYRNIFFVTNQPPIVLPDGQKGDLFNLKIILPDDQVVYLKRFSFNKTYDLAQCNEDSTDCCIYPKYKNIKIDESDVCFEQITRVGHPGRNSDIISITKKYFKNPTACLDPIS